MIPFKNKSGGDGPLTAGTGGTSKSDPTAGTGENKPEKANLRVIVTGDRVGAGILTVVVLCAWLGLVAWMITEEKVGTKKGAV
jgi:mannan endo-1,6-alpha-mannosidase